MRGHEKKRVIDLHCATSYPDFDFGTAFTCNARTMPIQVDRDLAGCGPVDRYAPLEGRIVADVGHHYGNIHSILMDPIFFSPTGDGSWALSGKIQ